MRCEQFEFTGAGEARLPAVLWLPDGAPTAMVQVAHGMTEHMDRYPALAEALTARGIALAGFDLRGHGKNPGNPEVASFGAGSWAASIEDMGLFFELLGARFPGIPHYMLGFSLGSFLLREYLSRYPDGVAGAAILGTGHQPGALLTVMMSIVKTQIRKAGFDNTTDLVRKLSFDTYNQKFKPNRTPSDWLCADNEQLDAYRADGLCRKDISAGLFHDLLGAMKRTGRKDTYDGWNREMPVLLLSGGDDPVGDGGKGVAAVKANMEKAGIHNIELHLLPGARHDILHEEASGAAEEARNILLDWLEREK